MESLTINEFDASICPKYKRSDLVALAAKLGITLVSNTKREMCLEIRAVLPPTYSEWNGIAFLNPEAMRQVLHGRPIEEKLVYIFVWNHCKYYPTQIMIDFLRSALKRFMKSVSNFCIFSNPSKWGSEQWLITVFYDMLGRPNIVQDFSVLPPGTYNFLLLDDAAYSGINLSKIFDFKMDTFAKKLGLNNATELPSAGYNISFYIVVAFASSVALNLFSKYPCVKRVFKTVKTKTISEIVEEEKYPMDWRLYNTIAEPNEEPKETGPNYDVTTVWFCHKIANSFGSVPAFLKPVMLNATNRSIVERAQQANGIFH